jgi:hypothetical protein
MASTLKQVLTLFEGTSRCMSLSEMARELGIEQGMLEGMIAHWIRKGKLREAGNPASRCTACAGKAGCPFVVTLPRRYEIASNEAELPCSTKRPLGCRCN